MNYRQLRFSLAHRLSAHLSRNLHFSYTVRHGLLAGMKRKGGLGFLPWAASETEEVRFLRNLDLAGRVVYDIGAFEGLLTLFFSRRAFQVVAWEPNPASRERLAANLELNDVRNVKVRDTGVSDTRGTLELIYDPLMPGAASGAPSVSREIRDGAPTIREAVVAVSRLDDEVMEQQLPMPDLIKIDVEGMELPVLRGAREVLRTSHPALYIELHGAEEADKLKNAHDVVATLWDWGYRSIYDVEMRAQVTPDNVKRPSHIYCTPASATN